MVEIHLLRVLSGHQLNLEKGHFDFQILLLQIIFLCSTQKTEIGQISFFLFRRKKMDHKFWYLTSCNWTWSLNENFRILSVSLFPPFLFYILVFLFVLLCFHSCSIFIFFAPFLFYNSCFFLFYFASILVPFLSFLAPFLFTLALLLLCSCSIFVSILFYL
jgi:hypothetical protein